MTRSEYQDLVEFLGVRFDAMDRRFDAVEDRLTRVEDRLTRVEVLGEKDRDHLKILAEGITSVDQKLETFRQEVTEEFRAVRSEMAEGFGAVWTEFATVRSEMAEGFAAVRSEIAAGFDAQGQLIRGLGGRVGRLEA